MPVIVGERYKCIASSFGMSERSMQMVLKKHLHLRKICVICLQRSKRKEMLCSVSYSVILN